MEIVMYAHCSGKSSYKGGVTLVCWYCLTGDSKESMIIVQTVSVTYYLIQEGLQVVPM